MNAETNWTPGPWKAKGADGKYDNRRNNWSVDNDEYSSATWCPITLDDGTVIACVVHGSDSFHDEGDVDENAALIAAAPELYAVLDLVVDTYGFDSSTDSAIWRAALAALAKARGDQ